MVTNSENQHFDAVGADGFIGIFDSGVGGISVLQACVAHMPSEHYVYFGDSAHAPFGDKSEEWVRARSAEIAKQLIDKGAKAIVIACNTATSAAAAYLRETYPRIPIIGIEPALKPAALSANSNRILVMATRTTLDLDKFHALARAYGSESIVYTQACPGLADHIETGKLGSEETYALLQRLIGKYADLNIDSVVLGCTHYVFIKQYVTEILGDVRFFNGNEGTANQLHRVLEEKNLLAADEQTGSIEFISSDTSPEVIRLYTRFFEMAY